MEDGPRATIIVPTRDRPDRLPRCLEVLARQEVPEGELEILIVDDGSREPERVAEAVAEEPKARLVCVEGQGTSVARNRGAREARAEFLCFTDDDCEPMPGWVACLVERLEDGADVVAAPTVAAEGQLRNALQLVANRSTPRPFAPGSNLGCRRDVVDRSPFDPLFGEIGGEDRDWYARLAQGGCRIEYEPRAVVEHFAELDFRGFWKRNIRYGRAAKLYRQRYTEGRL